MFQASGYKFQVLKHIYQVLEHKILLIEKTFSPRDKNIFSLIPQKTPKTTIICNPCWGILGPKIQYTKSSILVSAFLSFTFHTVLKQEKRKKNAAKTEKSE